MTRMWPHAKESCSSRGTEQWRVACRLLDPSHVVVILDLWSDNGALAVGRGRRRGHWGRVVAEVEESGCVLALERMSLGLGTREKRVSDGTEIPVVFELVVPLVVSYSNKVEGFPAALQALPAGRGDSTFESAQCW